jgi:hypothetical protein
LDSGNQIDKKWPKFLFRRGVDLLNPFGRITSVEFTCWGSSSLRKPISPKKFGAKFVRNVDELFLRFCIGQIRFSFGGEHKFRVGFKQQDSTESASPAAFEATIFFQLLVATATLSLASRFITPVSFAHNQQCLPQAIDRLYMAVIISGHCKVLIRIKDKSISNRFLSCFRLLPDFY